MWDKTQIAPIKKTHTVSNVLILCLNCRHNFGVASCHSIESDYSEPVRVVDAITFNTFGQQKKW